MLLFSVSDVLFGAIQQGLIYGLLALGVFISYRVLDFADLTTEGTFPLGGALAAVLVINGFSPIIAIICAFVCGLISGAITGILHAKFRIPPILAGIIVMTGLYSIVLRVMGGKANLSLLGKSTIYTGLSDIGDNLINRMNITSGFFYQNINVIAIIIVALLIVGIIATLLYFFCGTELGMALRSTGMNQYMSRAQGINTKAMIIFGLALANGLIALSGALLVMKTRSAYVQMGQGTIVIGLASIIIGEAIFGRKTFKRHLIGVLVGSFAYQLLYMIAINIGFEANDLKLIASIIIVFVLIIPQFKKQSSKKLALREKEAKELIEEGQVDA